MRIRKNGFTLVELLVVIGIIALLIGILLPALNKARDQANTVACESNMRQFFNLWTLYNVDNRGAILPCYIQEPTATGSTEVDWWSWPFLGNELPKGNLNLSGTANLGLGSTGTGGQNDLNSRIMKYLYCPSSDHSGDPSITSYIGQSQWEGFYYGDYLYNYYMGVIKYSNSAFDIYAPVPRAGQVPSNVIILTESCKPNYIWDAGAKPLANAHSSTYKAYYQSWEGDLVAGTTRLGTPHRKSTMSNILSADGHVTTVDPYALAIQGCPNTKTPGSTIPGVLYTYGITTNSTPPAPQTFNDYLIGPGPEYDSSGYQSTPISYKPALWNKYAPQVQ